MTPFRWRTPAPLRWRGWPDADEWVVFNPASGNLHLLNEPAARVLQAIEARPSSAADLIDAQVPGLGSDAGTIERLLASLDTLGLIEPERA